MHQSPALSIVKAPTALPIALSVAKAHLRVSHTDDDALITSLIRTAVDIAQGVQNAQLVLATYDFALPCFPPVIEIPLVPVRAIDSISYVDDAGATQTLATSVYQTNLRTGRARIRPAWGQTWPSIRRDENAVTVRLRAGQAVPIASVNDTTNVITATDHPFANADIVTVSTNGGSLAVPLSVDANYYVVGASGNDLQLALSEGGAAIDLTDAGTAPMFLDGVPETTLHALLLLISHYYENTEAAMPQALHDLPMGVRPLLSRHASVRAI